MRDIRKLPVLKNPMFGWTERNGKLYTTDGGVAFIVDKDPEDERASGAMQELDRMIEENPVMSFVCHLEDLRLLLLSNMTFNHVKFYSTYDNVLHVEALNEDVNNGLNNSCKYRNDMRIVGISYHGGTGLMVDGEFEMYFDYKRVSKVIHHKAITNGESVQVSFFAQGGKRYLVLEFSDFKIVVAACNAVQADDIASKFILFDEMTPQDTGEEFVHDPEYVDPALEEDAVIESIEERERWGA